MKDSVEPEKRPGLDLIYTYRYAPFPQQRSQLSQTDDKD